MEDSQKMALAFLLSTHLQFGNARQIECLELLRFAEELLEGPPRQCGECDGKGTVDEEPGHCDCCGRECRYCGGSDTCRECSGKGFIEWSRDRVYAMSGDRIRFLIEDQRKQVAA